jgi:hypothetical protein
LFKELDALFLGDLVVDLVSSDGEEEEVSSDSEVEVVVVKPHERKPKLPLKPTCPGSTLDVLIGTAQPNTLKEDHTHHTITTEDYDLRPHMVRCSHSVPSFQYYYYY